MTRLFRKHPQLRALHIASWGLALSALIMCLIASNSQWWGTVEVTKFESAFAALNIKSSQIRMEMTMGLTEFDIHTSVTSDLGERGFVNKTDTYFWGVISIQCNTAEAGAHLTSEMCGNREAITNLAGIVYVLLSLTLVFVAAVVLILLFSSTPVTHFVPVTVLYSCSILTCLVASLIFEIRLRHLFADPALWGATDPEIHSSLAGVDKPINLPASSKYNDSGITSSVSSILVWTSFVCLIASFGAFAFRFRRAMKLKSYIYSNPDMSFMRAASILPMDPSKQSSKEASARVSARSGEASGRSRR